MHACTIRLCSPKPQRFQQQTLYRAIPNLALTEKNMHAQVYENVTSQALARHQQKHHTALERNHTASTAWQTHNNEHAISQTIKRNPCTVRIGSHINPNIQTTAHSQDIPNLALTQEHARYGFASKKYHLQR